MPVVTPGAKILVTGANGFVASHLIAHLLQNGYSVRGTVRSIPKSGTYLKEYFKGYGERFEVVEVSDMTKEGAFDEAIQGVQAVHHTATPVDFTAIDPQDFIRPAVDGTLNLLSSALKHGNTTLKRIVYLSTIGAVTAPIPPAQPTTFSDKDWNDASVKEVETLGKNASPVEKYCASKVLAERAAWDFVSKHKGEINWDLSVINPPVILGPTIHDAPSLASLGGTPKMWYTNVIEPGPQSKEVAGQACPWIDVRDLSAILRLVLEKEGAGGERMLVAAGSLVWQDWSNAVSSLEPSPLPSSKIIVRGFPGEVPGSTFLFDTSKVARILGFQYRTVEQTARDILGDYVAKGWL